MKFLVQVCISEAAERSQQVFEMKRENLTMETLGLSLEESKALLRGVQEFVVAKQVADDLERPCPDCGKTAHEQGSRQHRGEDSIWPGRGAESTLASMLVSTIGQARFGR